MIVGKTISTLLPSEVFGVLGETEVLSSVFPEIQTLPCVISSPLREDHNPSFYLYLNKKNHVKYKDFATGDRGDLLNLLCKFWNCDFQTALSKISKQIPENKNLLIKKTRILKKGKPKIHDFKLEVKIRPWKDYDITYWQSYGCNIKLLKYCEVYPISHKIITKNNHRYTMGAPKYCYVFVEHKEGKTTKKVYAPFAKKYKWITDNDNSVIGLWNKVPQKGDRVCICSSLKDAIALWSNTGIPAVYIQGEAFNISKTALKVLKNRFKKIFICLDNDKWGLQDAQKLAQLTGFQNIILPPFEGGKDISDFIKLYGINKFKQTIMPLFDI